MPDIRPAVEYAIAQSGKPYSTAPNRFGPDHYDCSGLWVTSHREGGIDVPANVGNTVDIYKWAQRVGALVSVEQAFRTYGATLLRGRWYGYGALGHVEISLGDGHEVGAHGHRTGVGVRLCDPSRYQDGVMLPGVTYGPSPAPPAPPAPPTWRIPLIWLPHPDGKGVWIAIAGFGGRVVFLSVNGAELERGMDVDPADRRAFGPRTIRALVHRTRHDGKPGFRIETVEPSGGYVPKSQI